VGDTWGEGSVVLLLLRKDPQHNIDIDLKATLVRRTNLIRQSLSVLYDDDDHDQDDYHHTNTIITPTTF
jgi:hypothetical protein